MEDLSELIYRIAPASTPLLSINWNWSRFQFSPNKGGSMNKRRRRKARPIRFTAKKPLIYKWRTDTLHTWAQPS